MEVRLKRPIKSIQINMEIGGYTDEQYPQMSELRSILRRFRQRNMPPLQPPGAGLNLTIPVDMSAADSRWRSGEGGDIGRTVAVARWKARGRTVAMITKPWE
jgi:hypothetical protein